MSSLQNLNDAARSHQIVANLGELVLMHWNLSVMGGARVQILYVEIRLLFAILEVVIGRENKAISSDFEWL